MCTELEPSDPGQMTAMTMTPTAYRASRTINRLSLIFHVSVNIPEMVTCLLQDRHSSSWACWMTSCSFLNPSSSSSLCESGMTSSMRGQKRWAERISLQTTPLRMATNGSIRRHGSSFQSYVRRSMLEPTSAFASVICDAEIDPVPLCILSVSSSTETF